MHCRPAGHILVCTLFGEWQGANTRAYLDLPAVDILNLIHKAAAAMSPLATSFIQLVYFAVLIVLFIELFYWLATWNRHSQHL